MDFSKKIDREFGWDDVIAEEGSEYTIIPEGDYNFTIDSFTRGRHTGSEKMPACNKAIVKVMVEYDGENIAVDHTLFLHSKSEKSLSNFFLAIGLKKRGEPLQMNWNNVPGARGKCHVKPREYNGKKYNNISYFLTPDETTAAPQKTFQKGAF